MNRFYDRYHENDFFERKKQWTPVMKLPVDLKFLNDYEQYFIVIV